MTGSRILRFPDRPLWLCPECCVQFPRVTGADGIVECPTCQTPHPRCERCGVEVEPESGFALTFSTTTDESTTVIYPTRCAGCDSG